MSAFNVLTTSALCPKCGGEQQVRVQFKFGQTWQHEYQVGAELAWGPPEVGTRYLRHVLLPGLAESCCETCAFGSHFDDMWELAVLIDDDRIVGAATYAIDNKEDYVVSSELFTELKYGRSTAPRASLEDEKTT